MDMPSHQAYVGPTQSVHTDGFITLISGTLRIALLRSDPCVFTSALLSHSSPLTGVILA